MNKAKGRTWLNRGFVSALVGALAIITLIMVIALEWSVSAEQQAVIVSYSAKRVAERNFDANAFYNASQIEAEIDTAYKACGCYNSTASGMNYTIQAYGKAYLGNASMKLSDSVVSTNVSAVSINVINAGACANIFASQFNYTTTANSTRAGVVNYVSQNDSINVTKYTVGSSNLVNITVSQGVPIPNSPVARVNVNCSA